MPPDDKHPLKTTFFPACAPGGDHPVGGNSGCSYGGHGTHIYPSVLLLGVTDVHRRCAWQPSEWTHASPFLASSSYVTAANPKVALDCLLAPHVDGIALQSVTCQAM